MKRKMIAGEWRNKKISDSTLDGDKLIVMFSDGSSAHLPAENIEIEYPDRLCNFCGLTCKLNEEDSGSGLIDAAVSGGYDSTPGNGEGALDDCTRYHFSLCEFCLDWLFTQFALAPVVSSYVNSDFEDFRPAAKRVAEDEWRKGKEEFFKEFEKRNAARAKKSE